MRPDEKARPHIEPGGQLAADVVDDLEAARIISRAVQRVAQRGAELLSGRAQSLELGPDDRARRERLQGVGEAR